MIGVFKKEARRRFICEVEVENQPQECYISSSSHLLPIIDLINKKVLLKENKGKNLRTKYTVHALWENDKKVLLNLNYVNDLVHQYLLENYSQNEISREFKIGNYKSDFYIYNNNLIIEAKGILSDNNIAILPYNSGERCIRQLKEIKRLLRQRFQVDYYLILLNPKINQIILNDKNEEYSKLFKACIELGMTIKFFKVKWNKDSCSLIQAKNITL